MATEKFIDTFGLSLEQSLQEIEKDHKMNVEEIKGWILDQFKEYVRDEITSCTQCFPLKKGGNLQYDFKLFNLSGSNEGKKILEKIQCAKYFIKPPDEFEGDEGIISQKEIYDELNADISEIISKNRNAYEDFFIDEQSWKTLQKDIYDEKDTTDAMKTTHSFIYNDKQVDFLVGNILLRSSFKVEK